MVAVLTAVPAPSRGVEASAAARRRRAPAVLGFWLGGRAAKTQYRSLMKRLSALGFKKGLLREIVFPDWWSPECEGDPAAVAELEFRVARFLGSSAGSVSEVVHLASLPGVQSARLRHTLSTTAPKLMPAVLTSLRVARAALDAWSAPRPLRDVPADPLFLRKLILDLGTLVDLDAVVTWLWDAGIPVLALQDLPAPKFQAMACILGGRPVVLLGHRVDVPSRLLFSVAHELGHISRGDCSAEGPVIDGEDDYCRPEDQAEEDAANAFALRLLGGAESVPIPSAREPKDLADEAGRIGRQLRIDPGHLLQVWSKATGDYATTQRALNALWADSGGLTLIAGRQRREIDSDAAPETDRSLLRLLSPAEPHPECGR